MTAEQKAESRKPRLSWRKRRSSLRGYSQPCYELTLEGEVVAIAQQLSGDSLGQWFWYSMRRGILRNTGHRPDTLERVKIDAIKTMRSALSL